MDVYRIFKPVIYITRVFCLAPFAAVEDSGSTRHKFSKFSAPVQTGPGANSASCTISNGSSPVVKTGRGVKLSLTLF